MRARSRSRNKITSPFAVRLLHGVTGCYRSLLAMRRAGGGGLRPWLCRLGRFRFHNIDAAFEVSSVLDNDTSRLDISDEFCVFADIDFIDCLDVAVDATKYDYLARFDAGANAAIGSDREAMVVQLD